MSTSPCSCLRQIVLSVSLIPSRCVSECRSCLCVCFSLSLCLSVLLSYSLCVSLSATRIIRSVSYFLRLSSLSPTFSVTLSVCLSAVTVCLSLSLPVGRPSPAPVSRVSRHYFGFIFISLLCLPPPKKGRFSWTKLVFLKAPCGFSLATTAAATERRVEPNCHWLVKLV